MMVTNHRFAAHARKVDEIRVFLKQRTSTRPLRRTKKSVSHMVPKPGKQMVDEEKLDLSSLDQILLIDETNGICVAEPGVTFASLVEATLPYGLVPTTVSELKTITIGGAVAGCSIESMSYKLGGFHDSCLEYEVVTATGEVLICTPDNENSLIFQMMHGTFGTLGIITKLTFRLVRAKPFVRVVYHRYTSLKEYMAAIWDHYEKRDLDFMDGIIHSPQLMVLSAGQFVGKAPYTHNYDWTRIYYQSTATRREDYLTTFDYFFRYNKGVTNVWPQSLPGRLLFGRFINSSSLLRFADMTKRIMPPSVIPVTVDTFIPFSKMEQFMEWYIREVNHFPLWCVPYRLVRHYEWLADGFLQNVHDELFLDIALYGMKQSDPDRYYGLIEKKLLELGAIKTLISTNLYSPEEFWSVWNQKNYETVKQRTDPGNIFRGLYEKTCRQPVFQSSSDK